MDPPAKAGPLLLQQPQARRLGAKRWKKGWFALFRASPHGVARLEFVLDCKEVASAAEKRLDKKTIVRLSDCLSVAPARDCSLPKEGLAAFRLETRQRAFLLAAPPPEAADWVARLGQEAFPHSPAQPLAEGAEGRTLEMALNAIYLSQGEVRDFLVTVQKTEASERCQLQGPYLLKASPDSLVLTEPHSGRTLYTWPFRLLRRYGRDKVMFSFEAGRRCDSGPGNFTFETKEGNEIFHRVEKAIQAQKALGGEEGSNPSLEAPNQDPMAPRSPHLAGKGPPLEQRRGAGAAVAPRLNRPPLEEKEVLVASPKGPGWRDRPTPWPSSPSSQALPSYQGEEEEGEAACVYSEPLDALKGPRPDPLYADPADSRPEVCEDPKDFRPPSSCLLYEQVGSPAAESSMAHIYDEPEGRAPLPAPWPPDTIYDQASFPCQAWRTQGLESRAGCTLLYHPDGGNSPAPAPQRRGDQRPPKPCPAPKPPRSRKQTPVGPGEPSQRRGSPEADQEGPKPHSSTSGNCNNNSNHAPGCPPSEPIYSRVLKPRPGKEQSVDESHLASVYEDLGEI